MNWITRTLTVTARHEQDQKDARETDGGPRTTDENLQNQVEKGRLCHSSYTNMSIVKTY